MDDPKPDHSDDPRDQDAAGGGYAESNPSGADPDSEDAARSSAETGSRAPTTATEKEGDRAASTGNPHAAG